MRWCITVKWKGKEVEVITAYVALSWNVLGGNEGNHVTSVGIAGAAIQT
jgi:hypothetical protein